MKVTRRNRTIEIYFVLYLAALIFILPSKNHNKINENNDIGVPVYQQSFSLIPEKTSLTCLLAKDSTGLRIVSLDSINTIYYTGDVSDVKFEMIIEDQVSKQTLFVYSYQKSDVENFRIEERKEQHSAIFYWNPPLHSQLNNTYLVRVNATAILKNNENPDTEKEFKLSTQFSLNIIYLNSGNVDLTQKQDSSTNLNSIQQNLSNLAGTFFSQFNYPENFSLFPENTDLRAIAYQKWTNNIYANNINFTRDIKKPELIIDCEPDDNGGYASILAIQDNKISIQGKTPSSGKMKVGVKVVRKYDEKEFITYFNISPQLIQPPEFDKYMYPDQTYYINPNLPVLGSETIALIKDGNYVRARSSQGEKFQFKPDIQDTGKTMTLELYIDNVLYGQKYYIRILNHPEPDIIEVINRRKGEVEVITNAYGLVNNTKNEIVNFYIEDNARFEEKRGGYKNYTNPIRTVQHFIFTPKNPSMPFNFKIIAIDKRGKKSEAKVFKEY